MSFTLLPVLSLLVLLVAVQSRPAQGSFDGITTDKEYKLFSAGVVMGTSGWKTSGRVHIIAVGKIGMPPSNKNGLLYSCMFQTYFGALPYATESSIERTFTNLVVGAIYRFSFWQTKRNGFLQPMLYDVYADGIQVFNTVPNANYWVQVILPFAATSTSANIKFQISSTDELDRDIGIHGVLLEKISSGIYIIILSPFKHIYISMYVYMYIYLYV
jgi:hypothetical protein